MERKRSLSFMDKKKMLIIEGVPGIIYTIKAFGEIVSWRVKGTTSGQKG